MKRFLLIFFIIIFNNKSFADDQISLGSEIYNNKAQCSACHTLEEAGSEGQIGPNLDRLKPKLEQIITAVTNGIGVMPGFEGVLTYDEIDAVANYVFISTNK